MLAPDVALVGAARATLSAELLAGCDERGIRLIALAASDADRAHAAQLGLHEVFDRSIQWAEIDELVSGGVPVPSRLGATEARTRRSASVIAVWGPAGAPGRTTVAVNVAAEIAAAGHAVALVDADPYGGAIAPALGLLDEAPGFASACRLAAGDALDRVELDRIAQRYSAPRASFDVFTGLVGPSRWPELARDRVTAAIQAIGGRSEYVVIDTGFSLERDEELTSDQFAPRRNAATFAALASAERVVAVGLADPVGLSRLLRGHGEPRRPRRARAHRRHREPRPHGCSRHRRPRAGAPDAPAVRRNRRCDAAAARRQGHGCRDPHGAHAARRRSAKPPSRGAPRVRDGSDPARAAAVAAARLRVRAAAPRGRELSRRRPTRHPEHGVTETSPATQRPRVAHYAGSVSTLSDLVLAQGRSSQADVDWLHMLVGDLQLLADLAFADIVLWVPSGDDDFVAVAHARPSSAATLFYRDFVGQPIKSQWRDLVTQAFASARIVDSSAPDWYEEMPTRVRAVPVMRRLSATGTAARARTRRGHHPAHQPRGPAHGEPAGAHVQRVRRGTVPDDRLGRLPRPRRADRAATRRPARLRRAHPPRRRRRHHVREPQRPLRVQPHGLRRRARGGVARRGHHEAPERQARRRRVAAARGHRPCAVAHRRRVARRDRLAPRRSRSAIAASGSARSCCAAT